MPLPVRMSSGELLNGADDQPATYESAIERNENIVNKLAWVAKRKAFYERLWDERRAIDAITRHHVGNRTVDAENSCAVAPTDEWLRGGFNVCIPVRLGSANGADQKSLLFRCPLPHKLAEAQYPGTVDEKVGCEVGAYIWMQENCSDVRIPHLYGFGFSDGRQFTHASHCPWYIRAVRSFKRIMCRLLGRPIPSLYVSRNSGVRFPSPYILLERITPETGRMLSMTWDKHIQDPTRRHRLFGGMARIILSLARIPQPRIGSFRFHDDGTISLTNRPFTIVLALLENNGAPRVLQSDTTYTCTEPFVSDMLTFHDRSFLNNTSAAHSETVCQMHMAVKTTLRALAHQYIRHESRDGPFVLQHTDLSLGNVFVDDDWNVTCLIDLEWICALPVEELAVPYWLTNRAVDEFDDERLAEFEKVRQEFMLAFEQEEEQMVTDHNLELSQIMRETWDSGRFWFWISLSSINGAVPIAYQHILPRFTKRLKTFKEDMCKFWCQEHDKVIQAKLADFKTYDAELREVFKASGPAEKLVPTAPSDLN
ncbi:hypothetical protein RB599_010318 [Gaeumannomyces hyphopodioides]